MDRDPTRWSELAGGAPEELRDLLNTARQDVPDEREMKAMGLTVRTITAACVGGAIAGSAGGSAVAGAKATTGAAGAAAGGGTVLGTTAAKIGVGILLVGGATLGTWSATRDATPPEGSSPTPAHMVAPAPQPDDAKPSNTVVDEGPDVEEEKQTTDEGDAADPQSEAEVTTDGSSKAAGEQSKKQAPPPSEVSLLKAAQRALRDDPNRAMALVRQHQALYPSGQLVQEREVIRIKALERLGKENEASDAEKKFEQNFPDSAHRSRLEEPGKNTASDKPSKPSQ